MPTANTLIYIIASIAALSGLLFGYSIAIISGALLFIKKDFALTAFQTEIIVSALVVGAIIGSLLSGKITEKLGRKFLLIFAAFLFIISSLLTAILPNFSWIIIGRILLGVAVGISSFIAPLYLSELAPPKIRGLLVSLNQVAITIGMLIAYIVSYYFAVNKAWQWMFAFGVFPALLLLIGAIFLPESPRWLILNDKVAEASTILKTIRPSEEVETELMHITKTVSLENKPSWALLAQKWVLPILIISLGLSFFHQVTGMNAIIYYAPSILEITGFKDESKAILATAGIGFINVIFTLIALAFIDRWGRRPLLLYGLVGMFLSLVIMSLAFHFSHLTLLKWITLGSMICYVAMYAMSLGPVMWLIIAEIFPLNIRSVGLSLAVASHWVFNLLFSLTFLTLVQILGPSLTFLLYANLCILAWFFVYKFIPETKGCALEEIEKNLKAGNALRDIGLPI